MVREACRALITDESGKRLLLARRAENDYRGGKWSALGGKIDPGESPEHAVARETLEESGLVLDGLILFRIQRNERWTTHFFKADAKGDLLLNPDEHSEYGYFTADELPGLELAFDHLQIYTDYLKSR